MCGTRNKIALDDGLYDKLLQLLSKDCLISNDDDDNNDEGKNTREDASRANRRSRFETAYKDLTDTAVEQVIAHVKDSLSERI